MKLLFIFLLTLSLHSVFAQDEGGEPVEEPMVTEEDQSHAQDNQMDRGVASEEEQPVESSPEPWENSAE